MDDTHRQSAYRVRFDWGLAGAEMVAAGADVAVIVDVLSFTTTLSVAVDAGTTVLPYEWTRDAAAYAQANDAVLAVGRSLAAPGQVSLSPASLRRGRPAARIVLPSPNGSTIAYELGALSRSTVGACLRNADAIATWIAGRHDPATTSVAVIAAGERWPDGSLRPAVEDLWGAGAVLAALRNEGWTDTSPEARVAAAAWDASSADVAEALLECASGRELVAAGYTDDVLIAGEVNSSSAVPLLRKGSFSNVSDQPAI